MKLSVLLRYSKAQNDQLSWRRSLHDVGHLMVTITESAQEYLLDLLEKQNVPGIAVRVFILDYGTVNNYHCLCGMR